MKIRLTIAIIIAFAFIAAATATAGKPSPPPSSGVSNPMTANLDAGGFNIDNVGQLTAHANLETTGYALADKLVATSGEVILEPAGVSVVTVTAGAGPPTLAANPGSVYLSASPAALWLMTATGWQQVST